MIRYGPVVKYSLLRLKLSDSHSVSDGPLWLRLRPPKFIDTNIDLYLQRASIYYLSFELRSLRLACRVACALPVFVFSLALHTSQAKVEMVGAK